MMSQTFPVTLGLVLIVLGTSAAGAWLLLLLFSLIWPPTGPIRGIKATKPTTNNPNVADTRHRDDMVVDYVENRIVRPPRARPLRSAKDHESDADDARATREWPLAVRGGAARVLARSEVRGGAPDDAESEVEL
jgi:hypothetical protein